MLSALVGSIICAPFMERHGRRPTVFGSLIMYLTGWLFIFLADSVFLLFLGRVATGAAFGFAMTSVPVRNV